MLEDFHAALLTLIPPAFHGLETKVFALKRVMKPFTEAERYFDLDESEVCLFLSVCGA